VEETGFDIVLANINRESLRAMMPDLTAKLSDAGFIAFSGLLFRDRAIMMEALSVSRLESVKEWEEGDWWSVWCRKMVGDSFAEKRAQAQ
jgi:ribosomal protein L11 methylase PrmA